jgi:hypothetical protein
MRECRGTRCENAGAGQGGSDRAWPEESLGSIDHLIMPGLEDNPALDAPAGSRSGLFPLAQWLPRYQRSWLRHDVVAGITLAAYAIPVSLAYASLAGLPPQYGIYCYLVGGLAYALFGSSRQLAIGPTSAISMLVGTRAETSSTSA